MVMVKRLISMATVLLIVFMCFFFSAFPAWGATQHMFNETDLMSGSEVAYVNNYLTKLSEELEFDIVGVLISRGYSEKELTSFADDFYDYRGFGYGNDKDGVIFAVDMKSRLTVLVSTGYGTEAITDYGEEVIYDYVTESLRNYDFVDTYEKFADTVEDYVIMAREGTPVDVDDPGHDGYDWYEGKDSLPDAETAAGMGAISVAVGTGAGLFSSHTQKSKLKSVKRKTQANSYARKNSLVLTRKQDRFLYSTVAVMPRPKNENNNRRMGGGGTTIHMGSSGMPHGGGHARGF